MYKIFIMKTLSYLKMICFLLVLASCSDRKVKIYGKVDQKVANGFATLEKINEQEPEAVANVDIDSLGSFSLTAFIEEPSFYRLNLNNRQYVAMILTGQESSVEVKADGSNPSGKSEVTGSDDTDHLQKIDKLVSEFNGKVQQINQEAIQVRSSGDIAALQALSVEYQGLAQKHSEELKQMIWSSLPSLAAFYGIQQLDPEQHFMFFDSVANELNKEIPEHYIVKSLVAMVDSRRTLTIGAEAPEIALPNPEGEIIKLSSLRGNYVLIDFWAAWCKPCRMENPNVVRVYNQYKDENFEILGVSLDKTKERWLQAIEQDGLPWKHISDLKYFQSEAAATYQINSIPATYLIDPEGKIIGKNLRGPSLIAKLKEIFG